MSFLDGFARGMQMAQQAVAMREGIEDRRQQKEWALEDRRRANATGDRQADLQKLQLEQARIDAERNKAAAEAEKRIQAAGRVSAVPMVVPGKNEGEMDTVYMVGDQKFTSPELANQAAAAENTPLKIARRQYAAAQEVGLPDVARKYLDNYNATRTATEAEFKQDFANAMREGGVDGVIQLYNGKVKDGRQLRAQRLPDGKFSVATYVGGKLQGDPLVYQDENQFLAEQVARYTATPDAYLDAYHKAETRREGIRQFDATMGFNERKLAEDARQADERIGVAREGVNVQRAGVGVQREALNKPTTAILPTVTADGNTTYTAGIIRPDAKPGNQVQLVPMGTAPGMRNPPKPDPLAALMANRGAPTAGGKPAGIQIDENGLMRLDAMLNK